MLEGFLGSNKPIVGVDIGRSSIKTALVKGKKLIAIGETALNKSPFNQNGILNKNELVLKIKEAIANAKPRPISSIYCGTSLPESLVFTKLITFPNIKEAQLDNAIRHQAADFLPYPAEDVNVDWRIVSKNSEDNNLQILIIAAKNKLVNDFIEVFSRAGLRLIFIETKPISAARALTYDGHNVAISLVDIGSESSNVSIIEDGVVKITSTVKVGSDNLITMLKESSKYTAEIAAELFKTKGLFSQGKEKAVIEQGLSPLIDEVFKLAKYYQSRIPSAKQISEIRVYGGGSQLKGITAYFQEATKIKTILANPLLNIKSYPKELLSPNLLKFSVAIGISLRDGAK